MDKLVVGIFGKINSGKSTLVNSMAKENVSIVSDMRGSTSDCVSKMTEIDGIGRVQLIDCAGYDDDGLLAGQRLAGVQKAFDMSDIAIIVCKEEFDKLDKIWIEKCAERNKKYILCHNVIGAAQVKTKNNELWIDVACKQGSNAIIQMIKQLSSVTEIDILGDLVNACDNVLLCMPQDDGAPNGRLILPQSIVIRAIIDKGGVPIIAKKENFGDMFEKFKNDISLVITDSSVFDYVYNIAGGIVPITSFSVLFAKKNGDINVFVNGANSIDSLSDGDKILIMEACSHTLSHKDIGSVIIPSLLKKYTGKNLVFEIVRGKDEPKDWSQFKLVVHCGGCTQNRQFMLARIQKCEKYNLPITNYGILLAKLKGILAKIVY